MKLFNPRDLSRDELETLLVGREPLLEELLADLKRQATSQSRQHWLLGGPRGAGKTHCLGVIYHRVQNSIELSQAYLPVWLGEADVFEVYSAGTLLEAIVRRLVEEMQERDGAASRELEEALNRTEARGDDQALLEELETLLTRFACKQSRVLLVLLENLDALLSNFDSKRRLAEEKRLRSVFSGRRELLFVCTTPSAELRGLSEAKRPLFGLFRERRLDELTERNVGELFAKLDTIAKRDSARIAHAERELRQRVIHRLSGGNARAVVMAYSAVQGDGGVEGTAKELAALLDEQTAYFEAKLARLAPREGRIMSAMCLATENMTLLEIARATRLDEATLSTQMNRLEAQGMAVATYGRGGKGTVYAVADGLFRVWYQYRKGRRLLEPLVRFLARWFTPCALEDEVSRLSEKVSCGCETPEEIRQAQFALRQIKAALASVTITITPRDQPAWTVMSLSLEADDLCRLGRLSDAVEVWTRAAAVCRGDEEAVVAAFAAVALFNKGATLEELGRVQEAIEAYDEVVARFSSRQEQGLAEQVAIALVNKGVVLTRLNRMEDAVRAYDELIACFGSRTESTIAEPVARALVNKGVALGTLGRDEDRLQTYRQIVERFGDRSEASIARHVATALFNAGVVLANSGRLPEAVDAYEQVAARFSGRAENEIVERVATAIVNSAIALTKLGRVAEAVKAYDRVVALFGDRPESRVSEQVAVALTRKGALLGRLGRRDETIHAYEEVIARYGDQAEAAIAKHVAFALANRATALAELGNFDDSLAGFDQVVARFADRLEPEIAEHVASSLVNKASTLGLLGQREEALQVCEQVLARFGGRTETTVALHLVRAFVNKGAALRELGRQEDAINALQQAVDRFGQRNEASIAEVVIRALVDKAEALAALERIPEAIDVLGDAVVRFARRREPAIRRSVVFALFAKGHLLGAVERWAEALGAYDELLARLENLSRDEEDERLRVALGCALFRKGGVLQRLGKTADARAWFSTLVEQATARQVLQVRDEVDSAIENLLRFLAPARVRAWLEPVSCADSTQPTREEASRWLHVTNVLEALLPAEGADRRLGAAERRSRALGRVPSELRDTVLDAAERIAASRRTLEGSNSVPKTIGRRPLARGRR
jgi:tetratricopeptide (TPR) repeat protein